MYLELKYPGVFLVFLTAALYPAVRYYYRGDHLRRNDLILLFVLKYLFIFCLALFIFEPVFKIRYEELVQQKHILLFDNSASVPLASKRDSSEFRNIFNKFSKDASFLFYKFGDGLDSVSSVDKLDYSDNFSGISTPEISRLIDATAGEYNIKSVIICTDGNFTDADNFTLRNNIKTDIIYGTVRIEAPDIFIKDLDYEDNPVSESGNTFTAVIGYKGPALSGYFDLSILEKGRKIKTIRKKIPSADTFINITSELPDMTTDLREFEFMINPLENEKNTYNNNKTAVQRLLMSSSSYLVVSDTPSLDLAFFLKLLNSSGYSYDLFYENEIKKITNTNKYKALISFSLPVKVSDEVFTDLAGKFSSKLFFTNGKTDFYKLNKLTESGLNNFKYILAENSLSENGPDAGGFLLNRGSETIELSGLPRLAYNIAFMPDKNKFEPLLSIEGSGTDKQPVLFMSKTKKPLTILIGFSSFWKLLFNDSDYNFSSLMLNIIDRISVDSSSDRIRILPNKQQYYSGEKIILSGTLLDENLRPDKNAGATLTVVENALKTKFVSDKKGLLTEFYITEPGVYTARISSGENENTISKDIKLRILPNDLETEKTGSDTLFLKNFARTRNGRAVPLDSSEAFLTGYSGNFETLRQQKEFSITKNLWFFFITLALFIAELAIRKHKDLS